MKVGLLILSLVTFGVLTSCQTNRYAYPSSASALVSGARMSSVLDGTLSTDASPSEIDDFFGLGEQRDAEQIQFSQNLLAEIEREKGVAKIRTWTWHGQKQFHVMKLLPNGMWQGPNFPMGSHTSERSVRYVDFSQP